MPSSRLVKEDNLAGKLRLETMAFTWVFQVARARGIFLSEDPEHLSSPVTSHVGLFR